MLPKIKFLTFIAILLTFSILIYLSFTKITVAVMKDFNRSMLKEEIETVKTAFSRRTETIARINKDWSQWDDSYKFVQDLNKEYIEANLLDEAFESANLNLFLFFDKDGYIVYKKASSLGGRGDTSIPAEVFNYTTNNNKINIKEVISSGVQQKGFLGTTHGTFIFAVSPITTSTGEGPAMGALLMARYFNDLDLEELRQYTGYDLDFVDHTDIGNWQHPNVTHKDIERDDFIVDKGNLFSVYTLIKDSWGNDTKVINLQHKIMGLEYANKIAMILSAIAISMVGLFGFSVLATLSNKNLGRFEEKAVKSLL